MQASLLGRRSALLLPLLVAACGAEEPRLYAPLRYNYLPPIRLNVATVQIEERFIPSGVSPDVSQLDPVRPVDALRAMVQDRLQAFGTAGRAVFAIRDASLTRNDDVISGRMDVILSIYPMDDTRAGYAEARVTQSHTGHVDNLRDTLYDMTKSMMDSMNVELEFQIRRNLGGWLATPTSAPPPVQQAPLETPAR